MILTLVVRLSVALGELEMGMGPNGYVTFIGFLYWPKHDKDEEGGAVTT